jgi:hypothetical protein
MKPPPLTYAIRDGDGFWTLCDTDTAMRAAELGFRVTLAMEAIAENARLARREKAGSGKRVAEMCLYDEAGTKGATA